MAEYISIEIYVKFKKNIILIIIDILTNENLFWPKIICYTTYSDVIHGVANCLELMPSQVELTVEKKHIFFRIMSTYLNKTEKLRLM